MFCFIIFYYCTTNISSIEFWLHSGCGHMKTSRNALTMQQHCAWRTGRNIKHLTVHPLYESCQPPPTNTVNSGNRKHHKWQCKNPIGILVGFYWFTNLKIIEMLGHVWAMLGNLGADSPNPCHDFSEFFTSRFAHRRATAPPLMALWISSIEGLRQTLAEIHLEWKSQPG